MGSRPELARSGAPSALRAVAMRQAGASDRLVVAQSVVQGAGRAAYAAVNMQRGAFIAMYSGRWRYAGEAAPYKGVNKNVVEANDWRVIPPLCTATGAAFSSRCPGAMLNEPQLGVRTQPVPQHRHV